MCVRGEVFGKGGASLMMMNQLSHLLAAVMKLLCRRLNMSKLIKGRIQAQWGQEKAPRSHRLTLQS